MAAGAPHPPHVDPERQDVIERRYEEAEKAGLSPLEARLFARSGIDVGELRRLVDGGCTPALICRILF